MYAIEVTTEFCAAHQLRLPDGGTEPLHGHNWRVTVRVESNQLDPLETVMDFHILEKLLHEIVNPWVNQTLNAIPPFNQSINPSAERLAETIAHAIRDQIRPPARLVEVRITEAPGCLAVYKP